MEKRLSKAPPRMKLVSIALAVFCAFTLSACGSSGDYSGSSSLERTGPPPPGYVSGVSSEQTLPSETMNDLPPVKIGLLLPLSGGHAELGNAMLKSAQMALFDMGYANFELAPRDTARGAADAARAVIQEGAGLILGPVFADDVRAAQPVAQGAGINMISFSTDRALTGPNTFIMGFAPHDQVTRVLNYAAAQNLKDIGVIAPTTEYGNAVITSFRSVAGRIGVRTAGIERFGQNQNEMQQAAGRIAARRPQAVLMPSGSAQAIAVSEALNRNGLPPSRIRRLGTGLFDDMNLARSPLLEGAWFAAPAPAARLDFERRFRETYGAAPPRLATLSYDATALAAVLAQRGFKNDGKPSFDRLSITNSNGFAGIDGIFRFRPDGAAERGLAVLEFRQGKIEVVDPAPQTFQSSPF